MILRRGFLAALPLLFLAVQARALRISVAGLARPVDGQLQLDIGAFENLISDLAELLLPSGSAIAQSPGPLGLELGTTLSLGLIDSADPAWSEGARAAGGTQGLFELSMRKGLPASLDIGARMTHILGSEIWGFVMELGAAPLDGLDGLPDLALHAQVGGTVGTGELSLLLAGFRATISKSLAVGGRVRISPYGGYHLILAQGSASAVGVLDGAGQLHAVLLPDRIRAAHRGFAGVRLRAGLFTLGLHVDAGPRVQRFGLQVGLRY